MDELHAKIFANSLRDELMSAVFRGWGPFTDEQRAHIVKSALDHAVIDGFPKPDDPEEWVTEVVKAMVATRET